MAWTGSSDPKAPFGQQDPKEKWGGWLTAFNADTGAERWRGGAVAGSALDAGYDHSAPGSLPRRLTPGQAAADNGQFLVLFRFYDVTGGRVLIDGQDVRAVQQASVRAAIGIVPQDTVLFNDTIEYNIGYGRPGATHDEIVAAAKLAQIHAFIASTPEGYATAVGERGLKLSGGEKQRVAIARALLKNPRILILDDSMSSVDTETEAEIRNALYELMQDRTTFIIAHRIQSLMHADLILVLDKGRILQSGRHNELLEDEQGVYRQIYQIQTRIDEEIEQELTQAAI